LHHLRNDRQWRPGTPQNRAAGGTGLWSGYALPPSVVSDIARRSTDQTLVGMFGAEFRHIKADVGALITKQQTGHGLRELGLPDPGRTR